MADVTINDEVYSAADVEISWYGRVLTGVMEFNGDETIETKRVRVVGNRKTAGYTRGNNEPTGDITILEGEYKGLVAAAPNGEITRLKPAPLTMVMTRGGLVTKETYICFPAGQGIAVSAGSVDELARKIPLFVIEIKRK